MNDAIQFLITLAIVVGAGLLVRWLWRIWKDNK
jgi:hypothetical protein